ncbi:SSI family serine proteinase inhibitor [Streptomyces sulphureus]|uniref:SSI family serine proteinase inhibitor n=1 Tax=Streptomyces sulphureus TaxID=47758 RepID=UPI00035C7CFB|nr:SSI family serine proteinase inhibitor [Streptomyces sulphureus]
METTRTAHRFGGAALALAAALLPLAATSASAAGTAAGGAKSPAGAEARSADHEARLGADRPARGLELTLSGSEGTWTRAARLHCPSGTGTHPHGPAACADLARAHGDPDAVPSATGACSMIHDPVTASAYGTFRGRTVEWEKTFSNECLLHRSAGDLFRF